MLSISNKKRNIKDVEGDKFKLTSYKKPKLSVQSSMNNCWNIFKNQNRTYRVEGQSKGYCFTPYFYSILTNMDELNDEAHHKMDPKLGYIGSKLDGMFIDEMQKIYVQNKQSLLTKAKTNTKYKEFIEEMDKMLNNYQYGDTFNCEYGTLYIIGYGGGDKLKLIETWDEDGGGYPLEFYDSPKEYMRCDVSVFRIFDPMRLGLFNDQKHKNNSDFWYDELLKEIEDRKDDPFIVDAVYGEEEVDLDRFPDEYMAISYDYQEWNWVLKEKMDDIYSEKLGKDSREWMSYYDKCLKEEMTEFCCNNSSIDSVVIEMIVSFMI